MSGEEFVLSIIAIGMGSVLLIVGITKITGLIKAWINRTNGIEDETFDRMAKAFIQHKKDTERRLQNLEAIVIEDDSSASSQKQIEEPHRTIEIEDSEEQEQSSGSNENLKNMLR